jgi:DtxR family Mn-dependent transcriptional regulator
MMQTNINIEPVERLSHTTEDYLKAIFQLCSETSRASTTSISEHLGVTPASVTSMLKKLAKMEPALVDYQKHYGAKLTPEGTKKALEITRHHRLLELFLHKVLGYAWDEVHDEADRLEHVISEKFEERIAAALGHPDLDPHGDPIPSSTLDMPAAILTRLYDLKPGEEGLVQRVSDRDPELLRHLSELGIQLGTRIEVLNYSPLDDNLTVKILETDLVVVLGAKITQQIFIQRLD